MILLEETWKDLFLVSLAQSNAPIDLSDLLRASQAPTITGDAPLSPNLAASLMRDNLLSSASAASKLTSKSAAASYAGHVASMWELLERFKQMRLDATEYTCIKALLLFRPGL